MVRKPSGTSKAAAVLAKIAAAQGGTLDLSSLEKIRSSSVEHSREANSVMRSLHKPHSYIMKKCKRKQCQQPFQTNYCSMAYCSDSCLAADMRALGIDFDPYRQKRWESSMYGSNSGIRYRYEEPEYISTQTLAELELWATEFLQNLSRLREKSEIVESQQMLENLLGPTEDLDLMENTSESEVVSLELFEDSQPVLVLPSESLETEDDDFLASCSSLLQTLGVNPDFA